MTASPDYVAVLSAQGRTFADLAARVGPVVFDSQIEALAALQHEDGNLRAAIRHFVAQDDVHALSELAVALWPFWSLQGRPGEHLPWIDRLLERDGLASEDRFRLLVAGAALHILRGSYALGEQLMLDGEHLLQLHPDFRATSMIPLGKSIIAANRGDYETAAATASAARTLAREVGSTWAESRAFLMLARVAMAQRRLDDGLEYARDAIRLQVLAGDSEGEAWARMISAVIHAMAGRIEHAHANVTEALMTFSSMGFHRATITALDTAAFVAARAGDRDKAVRLTAAADGAKRQFGDLVIEPEATIVATELGALRQRSGASWGPLWDEGHGMPIDVAVRYAVAAGTVSRAAAS